MLPQKNAAVKPHSLARKRHRGRGLPRFGAIAVKSGAVGEALAEICDEKA
ncbi:MAG: hypothetical protein IKD28_05125 [Clostridia bacterium]|nr:hypothetical protein [Clostridia bacterium]